LTKAQNAEAANYPFCTVEPNRAIVSVPDRRLNSLADIVSPEKIIGTTVEFVDIAGLVKGASRGEGLGNKFLGNIRETQAVLHVIRCFEDSDVTHVESTLDPVRDIQTIETELILADIQSLETRVNRLEKQIKSDKKLAPGLEAARKLLDHLNTGEPVASFDKAANKGIHPVLDEMGLITDKKVIFAANVSEEDLGREGEFEKKVREYAAARKAEVIKVSAKVEEELIDMSDEEKIEFLSSYGAKEAGLDQVIHEGYKALGLISFFTAGPQEVRAWTIQRGWKAPAAAGTIHTDFEKGFIKAEVIGFDDYLAHRGESGCRAKGLLRLEGKEYEVAEADVIHFRFNV